MPKKLLQVYKRERLLVECLHMLRRSITRTVDGPRVIGMKVEMLTNRKKSIVTMELNITVSTSVNKESSQVGKHH